MTARVTPASLSAVMHLPSWPSVIQCERRAAELGGQRLELRKRLALNRDDRDVVAELPRRTKHQNGNVPLPAIRPDRHRPSSPRVRYSTSYDVVDALRTAAAG